MTQLNYDDMAAAVKGGLGDAGPNDIESRAANVDIFFGAGVEVLADGKVDIPSTVNDIFAGVAIQVQKDIPRATGIALHEADDAVPVLRKGRVWVYAEEAVDPTDPVFLRHTTATTELPGDFRTDIDTDKAIDVSASCSWVNATTAAGLALLDINLP